MKDVPVMRETLFHCYGLDKGTHTAQTGRGNSPYLPVLIRLQWKYQIYKKLQIFAKTYSCNLKNTKNYSKYFPFTSFSTY